VTPIQYVENKIIVNKASAPITPKIKKNSSSHFIFPFNLDQNFVHSYSKIPAPFGFDGLGEIVFRRTYSRLKPNGFNEAWFETVARVINGCYSMQQRWIEQQGLGWNEAKAQKSAQKMYHKIFNFKFLPPGRGLWAMGSAITEERKMFAALNNCAFVSTEDMWSKREGKTPSKPFSFLMDASMLGVGVGFDTKGSIVVSESDTSYSSIVQFPNPKLTALKYVIPDTREGWVEATRLIVDSYLIPNRPHVILNYDLVRPAGEPIRGFGGVASGPEPLQDLHEAIRKVLNKNAGKLLSVTSIVDIFNLIGKCVIAGNVRRTAEIAFGNPEDKEYIDLKNYEVNPERMDHGWTSNNSVLSHLGMDYTETCERIKMNGEPGFFWLENAQRFGRMADPPNDKDHRAKGGNPCLEQTLESYELCCLVETFPNKHETLAEYIETLDFAYLYAKTVTLGNTHWPETNRVMQRNRRIGCSMSGIAQFISERPPGKGLNDLKIWADEGYKCIQKSDEKLSDWLGIPKSVKTTSIKPSGTVSLLAGATPGMHYPESRFCIRRIRISKRSELLELLKNAKFNVEEAIGSKDSMVVEFPLDFGPGLRSLDQISIWEQLSLAALLQKYWADNQVSCTITFDPETESRMLVNALEYFQYQLK
ncbi:hypothetical protein HK096_003831, partial [Nowakowskiella sp. JEL0078]